jgi:DNA-binding transcriptional regulator YiaG
MSKQPNYFSHSGDDNPVLSPLHYTRCGLDNIYLLNGYEKETDPDGDVFVSIKDVEGLHHAIGLHLVTSQKVLLPGEIRFLRRTMDMTQAELGRKFGQNAQAVARWEKGKGEISGPADRLLRYMFLEAFEAHYQHGGLLEFLDDIEQLDTGPSHVLEFSRDGQEWANAA